MVKKEIRNIFREKRLQLSVEEISACDNEMLEHFRGIHLEGVQLLMSYYPLPERKEFNVALCEQLHLLANPAATIAWPKLDYDGLTMEAVIINKNTVFAKNAYGIAEPLDGEIADPQLVDAVFVPLLAFDSKGYRVGYGKGFYDRYLARCAQDIVKIGFCYFDAVERISDIDQFDVPLNYCITPMRVYEF